MNKKSEQDFLDFLDSVEAPVSIEVADSDSDIDESVQSILAETKKKIAGNLCVNTGQGSGGGFTSCNVSGGLAKTTTASSGMKGTFSFKGGSEKTVEVIDADGKKHSAKLAAGTDKSGNVVYRAYHSGFERFGKTRSEAIRSLAKAVGWKTSEKNVDEMIQEAKKKIAGNLCVNTGQGSGGGFTSCNATSGPADFEPIIDHFLKSPNGRAGYAAGMIAAGSREAYEKLGHGDLYDKVREIHFNQKTEDRMALNHYTRGDYPDTITGTPRYSFYVAVGDMMRGTPPSELGLTDDDGEIVKKTFERMVEVAKQLPETRAITYRGFNKHDLPGFEVGVEFKTDSIMSASIHPGIAGYYASGKDSSHVMRIKGKSRFLGPASGYSEEYESVYLPGQRFRVIGVTRGVEIESDRNDFTYMADIWDVEALS